MNLEQLCTSLELSKQLKELGLKQESVLYWQSYSESLIPSDSSFEGNFNEPFLKIGEQKLTCETIASAFTAGELLEVMRIIDKNVGLRQADNSWETGSMLHEDRCLYDWNAIAGDLNAVNTLARTCIYLIENNYMKIENINARIEEQAK